MSTRKHISCKFIYPSKDTIYKIYKFIKNYEEEYSSLVNMLNFEDSNLNAFISKHELIIHSVRRPKYIKDFNVRNYISFVYGDSTKSQDKAHDLLRHLRNACAHAGVVKTATNSNMLDLTDRKPGSNNLTLRSNLEISLLFNLINELIKTRNE